MEPINAFEKATGVKLNYQIVGRRAGILRRYGQTRIGKHELVGRQKQVLKILTSAWKWQLKLRERGIHDKLEFVFLTNRQ